MLRCLEDADTARPQDAAAQMIAKEWLLKRLLRVTACGVPAPPAPHQSPPSAGMIAIHPTALIRRLIKARKHMDPIHGPRISVKAIPLVRPLPTRWQHSCRFVRAVLHDNGRRLHGWMPDETRTDHVGEPWPIMLCIARSMNASEPSTILDEASKRILLTRIEYIACRGQEHHRCESREFLVREARRVLSRFNLGGSGENLAHAINADWNGPMTKTRRL